MLSWKFTRVDCKKNFPDYLFRWSKKLFSCCYFRDICMLFFVIRKLHFCFPQKNIYWVNLARKTKMQTCQLVIKLSFFPPASNYLDEYLTDTKIFIANIFSKKGTIGCLSSQKMWCSASTSESTINDWR